MKLFFFHVSHTDLIPEFRAYGHKDRDLEYNFFWVDDRYHDYTSLTHPEKHLHFFVRDPWKKELDFMFHQGIVLSKDRLRQYFEAGFGMGGAPILRISDTLKPDLMASYVEKEGKYRIVGSDKTFQITDDDNNLIPFDEIEVIRELLPEMMDAYPINCPKKEDISPRDYKDRKELPISDYRETSESEKRLLKKCRKEIGSLLAYEGGIDDPPALLPVVKKRLEKIRDRLEKEVTERNVGDEVLELLAKVYERLEEYGKAAETFKKASSFHPKDVDNLRAAAWCALADGDVDISDEYCQQALERGPRNGVLQVNLAITRLLKGDISGARDALRFAFNSGVDRSAAAVSGVLDWCEVYNESLPTTYNEYLALLNKTKDAQSNKESRKLHDYDDPLMDKARKLVKETGIEMQSFVAERLGIGYARAGYLLDGLEADGSIEESPTWLYEQHMKVYLDIDGVLLANDKQAALGVYEFVKHLVNRYPVYWLTTHCRNPGDDPLPMLSRFLDKKTMAYLERVEPTYWDALKTEAIDFELDFVWFDDDLLEEEVEELNNQGALLSWIQIDLAKDPHQLSKVVPLPEPEDDPLFVDAVQLAKKEEKISTQRMQRVFKIPYARAARIIDMMEEEGIIGPADGNKPRNVIK